jgi:putative ABC transport system permease protein
MSLANIAYLYLVRLKARLVLVQESFAVLGIAVGVALLFASQVASTSLDASVTQLAKGIVGNSTYQLKARGPAGFPEAKLAQVQRIPGVRAAVPVLEQEASVIGPSGQRSVDLIASDPRYVRYTGSLLRQFGAAQLAHQHAIGLPQPIAEAIGTRPFGIVTLQTGGRVQRVLVGAELNSRSIGALADSPIAVAPLAYAQRLTAMQARLTRIFVQVDPGRARAVLAGLRNVAGATANVEPADFDVKLFDQAAGPIDQATILFATICALVGFMFAYCSMLLTTHLRQALVTDMRRDGATRGTTIKALLFDAFMLGGLASLLGLALGLLSSSLVFGTDPGYLSFGFPVGSVRVVSWQSVALALAVGMLAAVAGVMVPMRQLFASSVRASRLAGLTGPRAWRILVLGAGLLCLGVTTAVLLGGVHSVQLAAIGVTGLILALLALMPLLLEGTVTLFDRLQRPIGGASSGIAVLELRSPATRARSVAIATTGAIAVFGSVAIQGGSKNLQAGLDRLFHDVSNVSDIWVVPPGEQNLLATTAFHGASRAAIARLPGVATVGTYHAGFLEYGSRRVWVLAPPASASSPIPPSQLAQGDLALANARLRAGGWAAISTTLADERHLHIGETFMLPAPRPSVFRVAALTTNMGWPPGAIVVGGADYVHAWGSAAPSAYNVDLLPDAPVTRVRAEIQRALGPGSGLVVQSAAEREAAQRAASRRGLGRLNQISLLVLIAAMLAVGVSMGSLVWQRKRRFARIKVQGYDSRTLWLALVIESVLLLGAGCLTGAVFGIYSEVLQSHALATVTGFPIVISTQVPAATASFVLVTIVAAAIVAVPGYRVARVLPYP